MSAVTETKRIMLPRIALIACGSFSPPTPMHLRLFEIARDHFEMQGTHKVIGGIISPTHDSYGKKGLATSLHRCAMLKLALQSSNWIRVSDYEVTQTQWMRTQSVLQYHQNFINNYLNTPGDNVDFDASVHPGWLPLNLRERQDPVQLKLLCGADLLESFAVPGLWADEDIENIVANHGLVVITRFGSNPEKFIFESDVLTKYQRNITLITNWVPNEVSSSMVRRLLNRGQSVKYLLDDRVLEYIQMKGLFNYKTKYITDNLRLNQFINISNLPVSIENNRNNQKSKMQIERTPTSDTEDDISEEHMDESDAVMNSMMIVDNKRTPSVFCCGEKEQLQKVVKLQLSRSSPGQAIQVITKQFHGNGNGKSPNNENGDYQPKKLKITDVQNV